MYDQNVEYNRKHNTVAFLFIHIKIRPNHPFTHSITNQVTLLQSSTLYSYSFSFFLSMCLYNVYCQDLRPVRHVERIIQILNEGLFLYAKTTPIQLKIFPRFSMVLNMCVCTCMSVFLWFFIQVIFSYKGYHHNFKQG